MKALLYGVAPEPQPALDEDAARFPLLESLRNTPMKLVDMDDPGFLRPDWVVTKPRLTGICGSDSKQVFMDWVQRRQPRQPDEGVLLAAAGARARGRGRRGRARPRGRGPRRGRPGRAEPVAVVRPPGRRADVPGVRDRRLQPVLELRRRARSRPASTPARRRTRSGGYARAHARPRLDAVQGARLGARRARGVRRPVRGEPALDHPPPTGARREGDGVRRRRARHVRDRDPARALPRRRRAGGGALRGAGRARPQARRDRHRPRARDAGDRGGRGLVGRRAPAERRPADGVPGRDRRRLRHDRQAGDVRGRARGCCGRARRW